MALLLRLNRLVDRGVAMAVVGYTDALVAGFLAHDNDDGGPAPDSPSETAHMEQVLREHRTELERIITVTHSAPT
jgi:hypothetical protein